MDGGESNDQRETLPNVRPATVDIEDTVVHGPTGNRLLRWTHRRRTPRFWLPIAVVATLLAAAAVAGGVLVPDPSPKAAGPSASAGSGPSASVAEPTMSTLPTPPTRPADGLGRWADTVGDALTIPTVAVQAYGYAQLVMARSDPGCGLGWTTLAGIGKIESSHGEVGGAVLQPGGRSVPAIVGPLLDGQQGREKVLDSDAGAFDGDANFDRAMGPLRLMPVVWRTHAIDADGDGILDPYDLDDAALAMARLLCSGAEDLRTAAGWNAAIALYRGGTAYARSVFQAADDYGQRSRSIG